jgi:hypothetical protein
MSILLFRDVRGRRAGKLGSGVTRQEGNGRTATKTEISWGVWPKAPHFPAP